MEDLKKPQRNEGQTAFGIQLNQNNVNNYYPNVGKQGNMYNNDHYENNPDIRQYPEANAHYNDPNAQPVEGEPIYPTGTNTNPNLARFVKQGYKDVWAAVLFLLCFTTTVVWGIVNMARWKPNESPRNTSSTTAPTSNPNEIPDFDMRSVSIMVVTSICASTALSMISLTLLLLFPYQIIYAAMLFSIGMMIAMTILSFVKGVIACGVILAVLCVFEILFFYFARRRIPFSAQLLKTSSRLIIKYPAIVFVNIILLVLFFVYMIIWSGGIMPYAQRFDDHTAKPVFGVILAFFVLIFFWTAQVIPNLMEVTAAGVMATMYFAGENNMPPNPTWASLKRATTTSFGSICFGSLLVAVVQFLRWLAESSNDRGNGANFLQIILICILNCIQSLIEYFNTYAFVHIAIYGCGYIEAAKRTFELCNQCIFAALFNDSLIGPALNLLTLANCALIGLIIGLAMHNVAMGVVSFFITGVVCYIFFMPVKSAATTVFVCFAEVPEALQRSDPELYNAIHAADEGVTHNINQVPV